MTGYRRQVADALRAVRVTSPTSFAWFGIRSRPLPRAVVAAIPPATARRFLVDALGRELYRSFYTQGRPVPTQPDIGPAGSDDAFVSRLSDANRGSGGWERGWRIARVERERLQVERDGLSIRAPLADCRVAGGRFTVGVPVSLRRPKELVAGAPGFYLALGDALPASGGEEPELRVYFNLAAAGARPLVAACTQLLNRARIPFHLKVLDHPLAFARCDAAVLYMERRRFDDAREALASITEACEPYLREAAPAFTQPIGAGVAVGEHLPSLGESFGASRCRLVAEGIVSAHERREHRLVDRVAAVARRFADDDVDVATSAIWCDGRCNWVSAVDDSRRDRPRAGGRPWPGPLRTPLLLVSTLSARAARDQSCNPFAPWHDWPDGRHPDPLVRVQSVT